MEEVKEGETGELSDWEDWFPFSRSFIRGGNPSPAVPPRAYPENKPSAPLAEVRQLRTWKAWLWRVRLATSGASSPRCSASR